LATSTVKKAAEAARGESYATVHIASISPSPFNPRKRFHGIDELAESIKAQGLIQPLIVRPLKAHNAYELVAGERRFRACKAAGLTNIPVLIRKLDDHEAREIIVTENLQREGLLPLEEAAGVATLLEDGHSVEEIAARLGRSKRWVAERKKLTELAPVFRKALEQGTLDRWTIGHYEAIATLSVEAQEQFAKTFNLERGVHSWVEDWTIDRLSREISQWQLKIVSAPWRSNDDSLPGGACASCPKRSSREGDLFDQPPDEGIIPPGKVSKHDRCLDKTCWDARAVITAKRKVDELKDAYGDEVVRIGKHDPKKGTISPNELMRAKKTDPKSRPAVIVDGEGVGQVQWVKPRPGDSWKSLGMPESTLKRADGAAPAKRPLAEREAELEARRRRHAVNAFREWMDERLSDDGEKFLIVPPRDGLIVLSLIVVFGSRQPRENCGDGDQEKLWQRATNLVGAHTFPQVLEILWQDCLHVMQQRLHEPRYVDVPKGQSQAIEIANRVWREAQEYSELVKFSLGDAYGDACAAIPEPASWEKERAELGSSGKRLATPKAIKSKKRKSKDEPVEPEKHRWFVSFVSGTNKAKFVEAERPAEAYFAMFTAFGGAMTRKGLTVNDVVYDKEEEIFRMKDLSVFHAYVRLAKDGDKEVG